MPRLTPCPACHAHVMSDERSCPHCDASLRPTASKGAVVLMGLALAGCPSNGEPEYGVPDTDSESDSASSSGTATGTSTTAEPEYGVADTGTSEAGEPDYGVPGTDTGTAGEPDYGVPTTETGDEAGEPEYGVPTTN